MFGALAPIALGAGQRQVFKCGLPSVLPRYHMIRLMGRKDQRS